jgi:hypothetical protein
MVRKMLANTISSNRSDFAPLGSVAIAVARDRERDDREHLTPSCPQSGHE